MLTFILLYVILPTGLTAQKIVDIDCSELVGDGSYSRLNQYQHGPVHDAFIKNKFNEWGIKTMRAFVFRDIFLPETSEGPIDYEVLLGKTNKWEIQALYNVEAQSESWMIPWNAEVDKLGKGEDFDYDKFDDISKRLLLAMKKRFKNLEYVEVRNEPTNFNEGPFFGTSRWGNDRKAVFLKLYDGLARAVQHVNANVTHGKKLKIGGPSTIQFWGGWIDAVVDYAAANNLPLDYIAWHDYNNSSSFETSIQNVEYVKEKMLQAGFTDYEMMVTELGTSMTDNDAPKEFANISAEQLSKVAVHNLDLGAGYAQAGVDGIMPWYHKWNGNWSMNMFGYRFMENKHDNEYAKGWMEYPCTSGSSNTEFILEPVRTPDGGITRVGEIQLMDKNGDLLKPTSTVSALIDGDPETIWEGNPNSEWGVPKVRLKFADETKVAKVRVYWPDNDQDRISIEHSTPSGSYNVQGDYPIYPQGHVMDMATKLKDNLLSTKVTGNDIRTLATLGDDTIALMLWNRNNAQRVSGNVALSNIPAGLGERMKGIRYLTDQNTANYIHDPEDYKMTPGPLADVAINPNRTAEVPISLEPLAICLLVFEKSNNTASVEINDDLNSLPVNVYPNPVIDMLNISATLMDDHQLAQYRIIDMVGNEIKYGSITHSQMNCSTLKSGAYIIQIISNDKVIKQIFIKK